MTTEEEAARRVAEAIHTRRSELGLSQQEIVARVRDAGDKISLNNLRAYEWGNRPQPSLSAMAAISRALGWEPDALSKIYAGTNGSAPAEAPAPGDRSIAARLARLEAQMEPEAKLTDIQAMKVLLGCLTDEQFRVVALTVNADERFRAAIS